jgi:hypothetical protein
MKTAQKQPNPQSTAQRNRLAIALPHVVWDLGIFLSLSLFNAETQEATVLKSIDSKTDFDHLCASQDLKTLWIFPFNRAHEASEPKRIDPLFASEMSEAHDYRGKFFDFKMRIARRLHDFQVLDISYRSGLAGRNANNLYQHDFRNPAILFATSDRAVYAVQRADGRKILSNWWIVG